MVLSILGTLSISNPFKARNRGWKGKLRYSSCYFVERLEALFAWETDHIQNHGREPLRLESKLGSIPNGAGTMV